MSVKNKRIWSIIGIPFFILFIIYAFSYMNTSTFTFIILGFLGIFGEYYSIKSLLKFNKIINDGTEEEYNKQLAEKAEEVRKQSEINKAERAKLKEQRKKEKAEKAKIREQERKERLEEYINSMNTSAKATYLDGIQGWVPDSNVELTLTKDELSIRGKGKAEAFIKTDQLLGYMEGTLEEINETYELNQKGGGLFKGLVTGGIIGSINPLAGVSSAVITGLSKKTELNKKTDVNKTKVLVINYRSSNGELKSLSFTNMKGFMFVHDLGEIINSNEASGRIEL